MIFSFSEVDVGVLPSIQNRLQHIRINVESRFYGLMDIGSLQIPG